MMMHGYQLTEQLTFGPPTALSRAVETSSGRSVLIRQLTPGSLTPSYMRLLEHDFEISRALPLLCVLRPLTLKLELASGPLLVLQNPGARPLKYLPTQSLVAYLKLSLSAADAIAELHRAGLVHGRVSPEAILVSQSGARVWLTDFGGALKLSGDGLAYPDSLPPLPYLPYAAPEQTGRMNRGVDHRADLYALGVTTYELLCGTPPFAAEDALGWAHAHLTQVAVAPHLRNPEIPIAVSDIVMRLLAKSAEERYQSAEALRRDLARCVGDLERHGAVEPFTVAMGDGPISFTLPKRLVGRTDELAKLLSALDRTTRGGADLVLIAGPAGVGKSALLGELRRLVTTRSGQLAMGSGDLSQSTPFGPIVQAIRQFTRTLLTESDAKLSAWRGRLRSGLGTLGRAVADVVPELKSLLGSLPALEPLPPAESQNRLSLGLKRFIDAIASPEHPFVLALDDAQWLDAASIQVLQLLLPAAHRTGLLVVLARGPADTGRTVALDEALAAFAQAGSPPRVLILEPLSPDEVHLLVAETFSSEPNAVEALSALVHASTRGNPLFVEQFLRALHGEGVIRFDPAAGKWQWDISRFDGTAVTESVAELVANRLERLPKETRSAVIYATALGDRFDLETAALAIGQSAEDLSRALEPAVEAGLLSPQGTRELPIYQFVHGRVRQAAYGLLPEAERQHIHLTIGRRLCDLQPADDEDLARRVAHLNQGASQIVDPRERLGLARLNAEAGDHAKAASAFTTAMRYFKTSADLLPSDIWSAEHALAFRIHLELAECAHLAGEAETAELVLDGLLGFALTPEQLIQLGQLQVGLLVSRGRLSEAMELGLSTLEALGATVPRDHEARQQAVSEDIAHLLSMQAQEDLDALSPERPMTDPDRVAEMAVLAALSPAAYNEWTGYAFTATRMVTLSLAYGYSLWTPLGLAMSAAVLATSGHLEISERLARQARSLAAGDNDPSVAPRVEFVLGAFVDHWRGEYAACLDTLEKAYARSLETGSPALAGWLALHQVYLGVLSGQSLDRLIDQVDAFLATIRRSVRFEELARLLTKTRVRLMTWMRTDSRQPESVDAAPDRPTAALRSDELPNETLTRYPPAAADYVLELADLVLTERFEAAVALAQVIDVQGVVAGIRGFSLVAEKALLHGIALAETYWRVTEDHRPPLVQALSEQLTLVSGWAKGGPNHMKVRARLLEGLTAEIAQDQAIARRAMEAGLAIAEASTDPLHEAICLELSGRMAARQGERRVSGFYFAAAQEAWVRFGALALAHRPALRHARGNPGRSLPILLGTSNARAALDLTTLMRATQAISEEIVLSRLLERLMAIVIEHAGARRAVLVLDRQGVLVIEAEQLATRPAVVLQGQPIETRDDLSRAILLYTARTLESVVLDDTGEPGLFSNDPYLRQRSTRSVLCTPIVHRELRGVLYLENDLVTGAFSSDHLELLRLLSAQIAISIENASSYGEAEAAKHATEALLTTAVEHLPLSVVVADAASGTVRLANPAAHWMGLPQALGIGRAGREGLLRPDGLGITPLDEPLVRALRDGETTVNEEYTLRRADGSERACVLSAVPIRDREGTVEAALAIATDITDRKLAEAALQRSESLLRRLMASIRVIVWEARVDEERFSFVNDAAADILGFSLESFIKPGFWLDRIHPEDHALVLSTYATAKADGTPYNIEYRVKTARGGVIWMKDEGAYSADRAVRRGVFIDITEARDAERRIHGLNTELTRRVAALAEANADLEAFSYSVSHDLQRPLFSLRGFAELLLDDLGDTLDPTAQHYLERMASAASRMSELVQGLLDFSRLGKAEPRRQKVDLTAMALEIGARFREDAPSRELTLEVAPGLTAMADPRLVYVVLDNLMSNAWKFTAPVPHAQVEVGRHDGLFFVRDNGVGFDMAQLNRLFRVFSRLDERFAGTGVGLATVQRVVQRHGGHLEVKAAPNAGATFLFSLGDD